MNTDAPSIPPKGDFEKAEKYITKLVNLIHDSKIAVYHTDLKKYDPNSIQDHYRIDLQNYQIEVSHSKQPDSGKDSFVMIFTNIKNVNEGSADKVILAYTPLSNSQFTQFKKAADEQIGGRIRAEEAKRFKEALEPIDNLLNEAVSSIPIEEKAKSDHQEQTQNTDNSAPNEENTQPQKEEHDHHPLTSYPVHQA